MSMEGVKLWGLITKSLLSSGTSSSGASDSGKIIGVSSLDLEIVISGFVAVG